MAKRALAKVILKSADPTIDDSSMHWAFESLGATTFSGLSDVDTAIISFFNSTATGASAPLHDFINPVMSRAANASTIEYYDITTHLDGSPTGAPVRVTPWTMGGTPPGGVFPQQAAIAVSYKSPYGTDVEFGTGTRPRARDRNRFYFGPVASNTAVEDSTTTRTKVNTTAVTCLTKAFYQLCTSHGSDSWVLRVWSRVDAALKLPVQVWVDDQFDSQRRRVDPNPASRTFLDLPSV